MLYNSQSDFQDSDWKDWWIYLLLEMYKMFFIVIGEEHIIIA